MLCFSLLLPRPNVYYTKQTLRDAIWGRAKDLLTAARLADYWSCSAVCSARCSVLCALPALPCSAGYILAREGRTNRIGKSKGTESTHIAPKGPSSRKPHHIQRSAGRVLAGAGVYPEESEARNPGRVSHSQRVEAAAAAALPTRRRRPKLLPDEQQHNAEGYIYTMRWTHHHHQSAETH